jgi:hypothetical protein
VDVPDVLVIGAGPTGLTLAPSEELIAEAAPYDLVEGALSNAAQAASDPQFRALVARILGSSASHPALMATYWNHYVLPRRALTVQLLDRAREAGTVRPDADADVLIDMMAGAVMYRVLQPDPSDLAEMRRYLKMLYRQVGLLPA